MPCRWPYRRPYRWSPHPVSYTHLDVYKRQVVLGLQVVQLIALLFEEAQNALLLLLIGIKALQLPDVYKRQASIRAEVERNAASIATAFENQLDALYACLLYTSRCV